MIGIPLSERSRDDARQLRSRADAEHYVASVCFKTGPPTFIGVELEHGVRHHDSPGRPLSPGTLANALGVHAPTTINPASPQLRLPGGGAVTVEPGGQVEISSAPQRSLRELRRAVDIDLDALTRRLADAQLSISHSGLDPDRRPRILVRSPRYDAMAHGFGRHGPHGLTMMGGTAGLQVCLDAGTADRIAARWQALHDAGPALLALFSTSRHRTGRYAGSACARMHAWLSMDGRRTYPVHRHADPALAWARYALRAPVLCVRRDNGTWRAPAGVSFADWIDGEFGPHPTVDDLDYHLSTLFPPVRPRGYLEVRYLDTQPPDEWLAPVAVLHALLAKDSTTEKLRECSAPAADHWLAAATAGLSDPDVATAAADVAELACQSLADTGLPPATRDAISSIVDKRLTTALDRREER